MQLVYKNNVRNGFNLIKIYGFITSQNSRAN